MASLVSIRRPLTSLTSRVAAQSALRPSVAAVAVLPRRFGTASSVARAVPRTQCQQRITTLRPVTRSIRWKSDKGDAPSFRQWGFEDITASLPAETSSPTKSPQKNLILVDVREPAELTATGIIPSAVCVPLASQPDALFLTPDEFETRFGFPKPGAEGQDGDIVFYCKAGVRARAAAQLALQAGYEPERLGVYEGSWLDWSDKKGKVEKWEGEDYE